MGADNPPHLEHAKGSDEPGGTGRHARATAQPATSWAGGLTRRGRPNTSPELAEPRQFKRWLH